MKKDYFAVIEHLGDTNGTNVFKKAFKSHDEAERYILEEYYNFDVDHMDFEFLCKDCWGYDGKDIEICTDVDKVCEMCDGNVPEYAFHVTDIEWYDVLEDDMSKYPTDTIIVARCENEIADLLEDEFGNIPVCFCTDW